MIEELSQYSGRIAKIDGPARSAKTEILVRRCATLLEQGVDPASILVVISSEFAGDRFRKRLQNKLPHHLKEHGAQVTISRALDVCTAILDEPAARLATGRIPRVLNESEYLFFVEDLKTLGQKNQRLHSMLMFFYAQWSAFEDESTWLIPGEESGVLNHMRAKLVAYGAMLRDEVPSICGNYLLSEDGRSATRRYSYVLCDDFQNLSRAEQTCMCLCAREQVMICGNVGQVTKVNSEYPSAKGFEIFERVRKNVEVFTLTRSYGIKHALEISGSLSAIENNQQNPISDIQETTGSKTLFVEWDTPEEELTALGSLVELYRENMPGERSNDVVVAVPNRRWGRLVQAALKKRGVESSAAGLSLGLGGDPRIPGRHGALSAYVKLSLVADPRDPIAWRAWTGFDDALTNSEMWSSLHACAQENNISLYDALERAAHSGPSDSVSILKQEVLEQAWASGQAVITQCRMLRGHELIQALGISELPMYYELVDIMEGDEDARSLCAKVRNILANPRFPQDTGLVHIALYENLCGLDYRCLIMPGMVDGMIPFRDALDDAKTDDVRQQITKDERKRIITGITKGTELLITSMFNRTDVETAERSKMKVSRIASIERERVALLTRSMFFDEARAACPEFSKGPEVNFKQVLHRE